MVFIETKHHVPFHLISWFNTLICAD